MIGALFVIAALLGYIAATLTSIHTTLRRIDERIADVTTEDYRHLSRIRIEGEI
jgi:hypothetical protein